MKSVSNTKLSIGLSFGLAAVNAGQRTAQFSPELHAVSTPGGFRITPPVSTALLLAAGDNIFFITNVDSLNFAINSSAPELVEFVEGLGLDWGSPEANEAIHNEFDIWAIAKGIPEYDSKGNALTAKERLTKADRTKRVAANFEQSLQAALDSDNEELIEALTREDITPEEQIDLLAASIEGNELQRFKGSRLGGNGSTGIGAPLTFSDSAVWAKLKADLDEEEAKKVNRVFDIDVKNLQKVEIHNGYEVVEVPALILGDYTDKEPVRIGAKEESEEEEA